MPHYRSVGCVPRKRHTIHTVDGSITHEELMGADGFAGASALLYHRHSPSAIVRIEPVESASVVHHPNQPLRPHHLRTHSLTTSAGRGDCVIDRQQLLGNDDVSIAHVVGSGTSTLYRNAVGDELIYVQSGAAVLESVFGRLAVTAGDYVVVPMCTTHRRTVSLHERRWAAPGGSSVQRT